MTDPRHAAQLKKAMKKPGNDVCADCFVPNPTWASFSLGIFLCIKCAGVHRSMGVHISKVKSLSLDKWEDRMIPAMFDVGNVKSNSYYLARCPPHVRIDEFATEFERDAFIRDKYQNRKFFSDVPLTATVAAPVSAPAPVVAPLPVEPEYEDEAPPVKTSVKAGGGRVVVITKGGAKALARSTSASPASSAAATPSAGTGLFAGISMAPAATVADPDPPAFVSTRSDTSIAKAAPPARGASPWVPKPAVSVSEPSSPKKSAAPAKTVNVRIPGKGGAPVVVSSGHAVTSAPSAAPAVSSGSGIFAPGVKLAQPSLSRPVSAPPQVEDLLAFEESKSPGTDTPSAMDLFALATPSFHIPTSTFGVTAAPAPAPAPTSFGLPGASTPGFGSVLSSGPSGFLGSGVAFGTVPSGFPTADFTSIGPSPGIIFGLDSSPAPQAFPGVLQPQTGFYPTASAGSGFGGDGVVEISGVGGPFVVPGARFSGTFPSGTFVSSDPGFDPGFSPFPVSGGSGTRVSSDFGFIASSGGAPGAPSGIVPMGSFPSAAPVPSVPESGPSAFDFIGLTPVSSSTSLDMFGNPGVYSTQAPDQAKGGFPFI